MKKVKSIINKITKDDVFLNFLSFLSPIIILLIIFFIKGINFDGEKLAVGDMQAQYIDMLMYFKNILNGSESIFYSITKGLGGDMFSTVAYYMLSPLNLILIFFNTADIMQGVYLIILIKFGLCSFTMYKYLSYKKQDKKYQAILFGLVYSLMAYTINNYFCIMWFDAIYMLPLIMMGIEKLVDDKKPLMYMICLFYTIFCNYYIGYMVCIYSVLYFAYYIIMNYKDKKDTINNIVTFVTSSILSGLSATVIFLPSIIDLFKINRSDLSQNATTIQGFIDRIFIGSYNMDTFLSYNNPCIYCSMLVITLVVSYFFNEKHTDKEKYLTVSMIVIFVLSIFISKLDLLWHGFSYPIGYNFRFTFLLCGFLIMIAFNEFVSNKGISRSCKNALLFFALLLSIYALSFNDQSLSWLSIAFVILYSLFLFGKKKIKYVFITLLLLAEVCYNTYLTFYEANNETYNYTIVNDICPVFGEDNTYRVAGNIFYGTNEMTPCLKSTTKGFYSTMNQSIIDLYGKLGLIGGYNYYEDTVSMPPIMYSLLGVKYIYSDKELNDYELYKELDVTRYSKDFGEDYLDKEYIYINNGALNLGYMIKNKEELIDGNYFEYHNQIIKNFSGIEQDVLKPLINGENENAIDSKKFYIMAYDDVTTIVINDESYEIVESNKFIDIENKFNTNNYTIVGYDSNGSETSSYDIYYLDIGVYESALNNIKQNQLQNIVINKNKITGDIVVGYDGTLVLTIPYENGWTLYVDGVKKDIDQLYDMFLACDLEIGEHKIELVYKTNHITISLIISIISIIMSSIFILINSENEMVKKYLSNIENKMNFSKKRSKKTSKKVTNKNSKSKNKKKSN